MERHIPVFGPSPVPPGPYHGMKAPDVLRDLAQRLESGELNTAEVEATLRRYWLTPSSTKEAPAE